MKESLSIESSVLDLPGVGGKLQSNLKRLEIETIADLIDHFPRRFDDFSEKKAIVDLAPGDAVTITGRIISTLHRPTRKRLTIQEFEIADQTGSIAAIFFNQPYLLRVYPKGIELALAGTVERDFRIKKGRLVFLSPTLELIKNSSELTHVGRIVPIYSLTAGLTSARLRRFIKTALDNLAPEREFLPRWLIEKTGLSSRSFALKNIHFPDSNSALDRAKRRLVFEELFLFSLSLKRSAKVLSAEKAPPIKMNEAAIRAAIRDLAFKLTDDQRIALWQIINDTKRSRPMNRLLIGDVGSGKTIVAALAALNVIKAGFKVVFMVPTVVLAEQHFSNLQFLTGHGLKIGLRTSVRKDDSLSADLMIGTQALLFEAVDLDRTGLVILDEQQRFGVTQRSLARKKTGSLPHLLSMTATPIPRTLALSYYAKLAVSRLREMPIGRRPVKTKIVSESERAKLYDFIRQRVKDSDQVFIVTSVIEPTTQTRATGRLFDRFERKAAISEFQRLKDEVFPDLPLGVLHGRMKAKEKTQTVDDFRAGKIKILVTTTVIEVGIDISNATVMVIEGADLFGLAQLHQLRGRVGRSQKQSFCFLLPTNWRRQEVDRLRAMVEFQDGFKLAERDLEIRGPGEFFGTKQSGFPDLKLASFSQVDLLAEANELAEETIALNERGEVYRELEKRLARFNFHYHLE